MNKMLTKDVGDELVIDADWHNQTPCDINHIIDYFTQAKANGATHIRWHAVTDYDGQSESCDAQPYYTYMESDEEYEQRMAKEKKMAESLIDEKVRRERAEYERLKAIFEKS